MLVPARLQAPFERAWGARGPRGPARWRAAALHARHAARSAIQNGQSRALADRGTTEPPAPLPLPPPLSAGFAARRPPLRARTAPAPATP